MTNLNIPVIKSILLSFSLLCTISMVEGQQLDSMTEVYSNQYSHERIYLHFDKSAYGTGETVWFKVYMMDATLPAVRSKTVYLDWIDSNGNILSHDAFPLVDGISNGQFDIPVQYPGKSIHVKAYTKWMMNFDEDFLYMRDLPIISVDAEKEKREALIPSLTFFPEGGNAIAGINCKIAFKANDQWGRPIHVDGHIIDNTNKQVASLTTTHDGLGFFYLMAVPNTTYHAKWKDESGMEHTTDLPSVRQSGLALQIELQRNERILGVSCTPEVAKDVGLVHIVGTMFQKIVLKLDLVIDTVSIIKTIPLESLPDGILTFTVFNRQWNPITERITFVKNNNATFETQMKIKQKGVLKRGKNVLEVMAPDSFATSLSVSITPEVIGRDASTNIISHLLLGSELKGGVYNSGYYFSSNEDSVASHLDLVMLTHGWRRFKWEDVVNGKLPEIRFNRDTNHLSLSGKLIGASPVQIRRAKDVVVFITSKDGATQMTNVPIHADGSFNDPSQVFFDTVRLNYSFPKKSSLTRSSVKFIDGRMPPITTKNYTYPSSYSDTTGHSHQALLAEQWNDVNKNAEGTILKEVVVKGTIKTPLETMDQKYSSGIFRDGDAYRFDLTNDASAKSAVDVFAYLTAKVPGLIVNRTGTSSYLSWRGGSPLFYIDEVRVGDSTLTGMTLSDIAYLKIFRPPFAGAPFGGTHGAVAIYTKRGNDAIPAGWEDQVVYGYTAIREFYSPNYELSDMQHNRKDLRTTLYWNPHVTTGSGNNKAIISFFNNDVGGALRVVIEGISREGKLTHYEEMIK